MAVLHLNLYINFCFTSGKKRIISGSRVFVFTRNPTLLSQYLMTAIQAMLNCQISSLKLHKMVDVYALDGALCTLTVTLLVWLKKDAINCL